MVSIRPRENDVQSSRLLVIITVQSVTQFSERPALRDKRSLVVHSSQIVLPPSTFARARCSAWPRTFVDRSINASAEHHPEGPP